MKYIETQKRAVAKLITWRIWITLSNFSMGWYMTGSWQGGLAFSGAAMIINTGMFYIFDQVWNRIQWGKTTKTY